MIFPWCGFFFKRTLDFTTARLSDNGVSQFRWNLLYELSVYKAGPLSKKSSGNGVVLGFYLYLCSVFQILPFYSCNTKNREISDMIR